jgi:alpha-L-rhamnosidase
VAGNQNAAMNSFSHYAFGAVGEWMFRTLAGIDLASPGYRAIRIAPSPPRTGTSTEGPAITWVRARYDALPGRIISHWQLKSDGFHLNVVLPANTTASIHLPCADPALVTEGGQPLRRVKDLTLVAVRDGRVVVAVGSGAYRFRCANKL